MLSPKRTKFRRYHRGRRRGVATRGNVIIFGNIALQAIESGWLSARQIEAGRRVMTRYARKGGKLWIRVFPDLPITQKPAETRMGSGKGSPEYWVAVIKPGRILYELAGVPLETAQNAMRIASSKMPMKTKIIFATEAVASQDS
jgi:large subunit ribosomal protein L16